MASRSDNTSGRQLQCFACYEILETGDKFCRECGSKVDEQAEVSQSDGEACGLKDLNLKDYFATPGNENSAVDKVKTIQEQMTKLHKAVKDQVKKYVRLHKDGKKACRLLPELLDTFKLNDQGSSLQEYCGEVKYDSFVSSMKSFTKFFESAGNLKLFCDVMEEVVMISLMAYRMGTDLARCLTQSDKVEAMKSWESTVSKAKLIASHVKKNGELYRRVFEALVKLYASDTVTMACQFLLCIYDKRASLMLWISENPMKTAGIVAIILGILAFLFYMLRSGKEENSED